MVLDQGPARHSADGSLGCAATFQANPEFLLMHPQGGSMRKFLATMAMVVLAAACSSGATDAPTATVASGTLSPAATPTTAAPTDPPATATPEPTEAPNPVQDLVVVDYGFSKWTGEYDDGPNIGYGVIIENPNALWSARVDVVVAFLDSNQDIVDTVEETFVAVLPGQRVAMGDSRSDFTADYSDVKSMEVTLAEPDWEELDEEPGAYTFERIKLTEDDYSGFNVTARLKSTFETVFENPQVVAILYRDGKISGGGYTYIDNANDDAAIKLSASGHPKSDKVELYGFLTSLSLF